MKRRPFTRTEVKHLVYLHMERDGMTKQEAEQIVRNLIESQKTLPTPLKTRNKHSFKEEFKKLTRKENHDKGGN